MSATQTDSSAGAAGSTAGFARLHPLTPLLRGWAFLVAGAIAVGQQLLNGDLDLARLALTGGAVLAFGVAAGALSWWFTRFRIDAHELRVESGVLVRRSRRIAVERLQAVDVVQPLAGRLLGLAELRLEVAGGSGSEAALAYLPMAEAQRVRRILLSAAGGGPAEVPLGGPVAWGAGQRRWARVAPGLLLAGLLLSSRFLLATAGLTAVAAALALAGQYPALPFLLAGIVANGALLLRTFLAEYGFTLSQAPGGLRIERGLLDLRSSSVVPGRVQGVVVVEPLLWRVRGWVRLEVTVAGYAGGEDSAESFATLLPIGPSGQAEAIVSEVLPGVSVAGVALTCAPPRARWLRPVGWRALAAGADDGAVVTRSGWLVRRTQVVPHAKIQSVRLRQGPLQRRLGLVDIVVDSPPGPVNATAKHRPAKMARGFAVGLLSNAQRARRLVRARDPSV